MTVNAYQIPQVLQVTFSSIQPNCDRTGVYMITSQHYHNPLVKLFRNTDQRVDVLMKDFDKRPIKLEEWQLVYFKVFDDEVEVLQVEASLIDFDRGHYAVDLSAAQTGALSIGDYTWCLIVNDTTLSTTRMLFTNVDYGAAAPLRVIEGPLPTQKPSLAIDPTTLTPLGGFFLSSPLIGAAQTRNITGVHSIVLTLVNFTGTLDLQTSLDLDSPINDGQWIDTYSTTYTAETNVDHVSLTGNYNWVRIKLSSITGLTTISYRNQ